VFVPVKFQGFSDDVLMAWSTHTNEYIEATTKEYGHPCLLSVIAPSGDGLAVVGTYNVAFACWAVGFSPLNHSSEMPRWVVEMQSIATNLASPVIVLNVPSGTVITDISSGENGSLIVQHRPQRTDFGLSMMF